MNNTQLLYIKRHTAYLHNVKQLLRKVGIDRAVFFVLLGRGFAFVSQPITLYLIATYFTLQEQGFYYTFANILSLSIFLELGLGVVLTQFASHEFAYLTWTTDGSLAGDKNSLSRLLSILRKSLKWYGILSLLFVIILVPAGLSFFGSNSDSIRVNFASPWVYLVLFSTLNLMIYPILAVIEGCGRVAELQKMRLYQAFFGAISIWIVIVIKGNLFAASVLAISNFIISSIWMYYNHKGLILQLITGKDILSSILVSWKKEILPMQWRIALSWASGYLIFQLFNPLLFRYQGAITAGQMGMSLSISSIALSFSIAWISTKFPLYGALIQKKRYAELDEIAFKGTMQALLFNILLSIAIIVFIYGLKIYSPIYGDRVLSVPAIAALLFSNLINLIVTSMAGYLRAHKAEPLLINSILGAAVTALTAWVCALYYSAEVLAFAIAGLSLVLGLPLTTYIFVKKRSEWHNLPVEVRPI